MKPAIEIRGGKFLVTGGASLIGFHLTRRLLEDGAAQVILYDNLSLGTGGVIAELQEDSRVSVVRGDILRFPMLLQAMQGIDGVFALAAYLTLPLARDPALGVEVNAMGTVNVLEAARLSGGTKTVLASSIAVYGSEIHELVNEATPFRSDGISPAFACYAATKLLGETLGRLYAEKYGLPVCNVRFSTVYGENQHERGVNALFIVEAIHAVRNGQRPTIRGDGTEAHDYLHAGDAARAMVLAMQTGAAGESYNVVSGRSTNVNEIVAAVLSEYGSELEPERVADTRVARSTGHSQLLISNRKAREQLGWEPGVTVAEGIHRLRRWLDHAATQ
jgi:UDP-glucose 4-epimerase